MNYMLLSLCFISCTFFGGCSTKIDLDGGTPPFVAEETKNEDVPYVLWGDDEEALCAVAYLGYDYGDFLVQDHTNYMPPDVPTSTIEVAGDELYLIIPRHTDISGTVSSLELFHEDQEVREEIFQVEKGAAFVLRCNQSDIMPNSEITLTDGEKSTTFSPYISLKDGTMELGEFAIDVTTWHEHE